MMLRVDGCLNEDPGPLTWPRVHILNVLIRRRRRVDLLVTQPPAARNRRGWDVRPNELQYKNIALCRCNKFAGS